MLWREPSAVLNHELWRGDLKVSTVEKTNLCYMDGKKPLLNIRQSRTENSIIDQANLLLIAFYFSTRWIMQQRRCLRIKKTFNLSQNILKALQCARSLSHVQSQPKKLQDSRGLFPGMISDEHSQVTSFYTLFSFPCGAVSFAIVNQSSCLLCFFVQRGG